MALEKITVFLMIETNIDNELINSLKLSIIQQNQNIALGYSHLVDNNYISFVSRFDLHESGFQHLYKRLVSEALKKYTGAQRVVCSTIPSFVCYFPNLKYYHTISHPLCKNCHSVFLPLTQWTESNTIGLKYGNEILSIGHKINSCYIIEDNDMLIIPEHPNTSNDAHLALFFYIMSYQNYKSSMVYSSKNIGDFFSLL